MNFKKAGIFRRSSEGSEQPEVQNDSGGMLAVWGSPGSGKTVTAVKIAKMLSAKKKNVILMCEDIREELVRAEYLDQYRITQIKEKYGTLCWYDFGCTERMLRDIIPKYERLSARTCIRCGNPATKASTGWISPYCDTCAGKISHAERFIPIEEWLSGSGDEVASERIVNEKDTHSL